MFTPIGFFASTDDLPEVIKDFFFYYDAEQGSSWTDQSGNNNNGTETVIGSGGSSSITHYATAAPYWQLLSPQPTVEKPFVQTATAAGNFGTDSWCMFGLVQVGNLTKNTTFLDGRGTDVTTQLLTLNTSRQNDEFFANVRGSDGTLQQLFSDGIVEDTWYMVVMQWDSVAGTMKYYINNLQNGDSSTTSENFNLDQAFKVGPNSLSSNADADSKIAAIGFAKSKALSPAELSELYKYYQPTYSLPQPRLLDDYPNAAFAYSVRKLAAGYTGDCMRIYKQTGGTTQDFGFDADGYLDVDAIETYLGASNGYVDIWYDQSGNGNDLDIGATGTRALIAPGGTITKNNGGKASMKRVAPIGVSTGVTSRGDKTMITCAQNNENGGATAAARIISNFNGISSIGNGLLMMFYRPNGMRVFDGGGGAIYFPGVRPNEAAIAGYTKDGGDLLGTYNGQTQTTPTSTGNVDSDNFPIYVFDDRGGGNEENSDGISEVVVWDNEVYNVGDVADNLNDFYGLY